MNYDDLPIIRQRRQMIKDAGYCLTYWQQRLAEKPNDAWARCEVERWKTRIEGLETAIIALQNALKARDEID